MNFLAFIKFGVNSFWLCRFWGILPIIKGDYFKNRGYDEDFFTTGKGTDWNFSTG